MLPAVNTVTAETADLSQGETFESSRSRPSVLAFSVRI